MEVFTPYSGLDILNIRYPACRAKISEGMKRIT